MAVLTSILIKLSKYFIQTTIRFTNLKFYYDWGCMTVCVFYPRYAEICNKTTGICDNYFAPPW